MSQSFEEALRSVAARMPTVTRETEILRVSAHLDDKDEKGPRSAQRAVLAWAQRRSGGQLPPEAWDGQEFDYLSGGRNSSAVRVSTKEIDIWALRADDPDKNIPGRTWTTEVVIGGRTSDRPRFTTRLMIGSSEEGFDIVPAVPGFVRQLIGSPGLVRGARMLRDNPTYIESKNSAEDLCDYLLDPERGLPTFLLTLLENEGATPMVRADDLARTTAGLARVFVLPADLTFTLTDRLGKLRSVFGGAVRCYMPGFSEVDDPYKHRLFLADQLITREGQEACEVWLRRTAARTSVVANRLGSEVPEFAKVRTVAKKLRSQSSRSTSASDAESLALADQLVESLEAELKKKESEIGKWVDEIESAEARATESELEYRSLLFRFRELEDRMRDASISRETPTLIPSAWSEFTDWLDKTYPDRVLLTPRARSMLRRPAFREVEKVARCVSWLAEEVYEVRTVGGRSLRDAILEEGVRNTLSGGDEYPILWQNRSYVVDWHIKSGGNTRDPTRCLRIYYFWEPDTRQVIIDHLPSHRTTGAS